MPTERQLNDTPLRVLLVEDNTEDAFLLTRHLQRAGYDPTLLRVETAEAMRNALEEPAGWDLILADYHLPDFSAPAALALLKSTRHDIPFIMMSGAIDEDTAVSAMRAGAHDYVAKQNLRRLVPAIERELKEAEGRRLKRDAEAALRFSEQRFHRLVEAMPLALLISDAQGRITYANDAVERLLGYTQGQFESGNVTLTSIFGTQGSAFTLTGSDWLRDSSEPFEVECINVRGDKVAVLIGAAELNPEAAPQQRQIAAFLADLTEQKRSQEVLRRTEKLAAAGRLAASIAHEINNPLEAVINCLYLMGHVPLPEPAQHFLSLAQRELDRVVHITTQTLRFYRQSTKPIETDIHELFETVITLYEGRLRSLCIAVDRRYGKIPPIVAYDGEIRQVLSNLVGNAIDAMAQQQHGRVILRTAPGRDWKTDREGVTITLADTGAGMDADTMSRIFEPFFSTKGITGTGLGLWVSLGIINKHHGKVALRSRTGQNGGTVFRVFLPFDSVRVESGEPPLLQASA
ncbi:PAS domain S-box-containing protein [Silvibacterium bohemicum]|uniref:histidine kinase n=1 Tax=Silvibacterium bohemicum TaxID=1577686 RepID=A0A841JU87_9BACT|nr:hybrid sensor histidine kinase/response regulator [Silvibacterium bohemicum]MBB6143319.1 PAS domain S-box-containing protein [Silvibacterium bohemicum]